MVEQEHGYVKHGDTFAKPADRSKGDISKMTLGIPTGGLANTRQKNAILKPRITVWMPEALPTATV